MFNALKLDADRMMTVQATRNVTLAPRNAFLFATEDLVHRVLHVMLGTTKNTAHAHHPCREMGLHFAQRVRFNSLAFMVIAFEIIF